MTGNQAGSALSGRLTALDSAFLYGETANSPLNMGGLLIFEGALPFDKFFEFVRQRLDLLPRCYRQRLAEVPFDLAHPTLEDDPDFHLENHVQRYQLPAGLSEIEAARHILRVYHPPLERKHPLWQLLSFEGWNGANTCLVSKLHHTLADGLSSIELMKVLLDFRPEAPAPPPAAEPWKPAAMRGPLEKLIGATRDLMVQPIDAVTGALASVVGNPAAVLGGARRLIGALRELTSGSLRPLVATPWNGGLVGRRRDLTWVRNSFRDYRAIRNVFGGTINDIVVTVLTEAAARYLKHHGYSTDGFLRLGCPVSVRQSEEQTDLGNRVSMMFPTVPAAPMKVIQRLRAVREEIEQIKTRGLPQMLGNMAPLGDLTPPALMAGGARLGVMAMGTVGAIARASGWRPRPDGFLMRPPGFHFVATNVPGVQVPLYLAGYRCLEQIGLVPLGANLGYGVAILSYNGELCYGMVADPDLVPDLVLMKAYVEQVVRELKAESEKRAVKEQPEQPKAAA
jgi:diacylglycerol O-acyltransferase / wax synthase